MSHSAFTPQPQGIIALCPVLIFRPTEGRRLSWPGWLYEILRWFARPKTVTHPSTSRGGRESNSRPSSRKSNVLTTELTSHLVNLSTIRYDTVWYAILTFTQKLMASFIDRLESQLNYSRCSVHIRHATLKSAQCRYQRAEHRHRSSKPLSGVRTFRPTDSSPHGRFAQCMDISPHGRFAHRRFARERVVKRP